MKMNRWKIAFWIAVVVAVVGWYYAYHYFDLFWQMADVADDAIALAKQCVASFESYVYG